MKTMKEKILHLLDTTALAPKEIAAKLKTDAQYVHTVAWKAKKNRKMQKSKKILDAVREMNLNSFLDSRNLASLPKQFTEVKTAALGIDKKPDLVNHPPHYKAGGIETIDFIEAKDLNFRLGNVVKYVARAGRKATSDPLEDLKKAEFYLKREIAARERA